MLKNENLKLVNDLKDACVSDVEKQKSWENEAISIKLAQKAEYYGKRVVPQRKGLRYNIASSSQSVPNNVPAMGLQASACEETQGTSIVHPDKKMQNLYNNLQNMKEKGIDFKKQKNFKPFKPAHSKYIDVPDRKICWHCGMSGHQHPLCPQPEHLWGNIPSIVKASVQNKPNIPLSAKIT